MAFVTWEDTVSNGSQVDYNIIFPFLDRDHVTVKFNSAVQPSTAYTFLSDGQLRLVTAASSGVTVRVQRLTPQTVLTDFVGGAVLPEVSLDNGYLQNLYHAQELQDLYDEQIAGAVSVIGTTPAHNLVATVAPTVDEDSGDGYGIGSNWFDTVARKLYVATDVSLGAAVWTVVSQKNNVSASAPGVTDDIDSDYDVYSLWYDTTTKDMYMCTDNSSGAAVWLDTTVAHTYPFSHSGRVDAFRADSIISAATIDFSGANGNYVIITGSTGPITSLGTVDAGSEMDVYWTGTPTLTHHVTQLRLITGANIVVEAGDRSRFRSDGSGNWTQISHHRADGKALTEFRVPAHTGSTDLTSGSPTAVSLVSGLTEVEEIDIHIEGFSTSAANQAPLIQIGPSGGLKTSGYSGRGWANLAGHSVTANGAGFLTCDETNFDAATAGNFVVTLKHMGSNVWSFSSIGDTSGLVIGGAGLVTLSGELDQVTITTTGGAGTFDGGTAYLRSR